MASSGSPRVEVQGHGARNRGEALVVIANPRAGGGRAGANRAIIEAAVARAFERGRVIWTERPGHAAEIARRVAPEADIVAALGGDGTCHEVVNGLIDGDTAVNRKCIFAVLPYGTGGDLVRSLEVKSSLESALWVAATGMTLHLDAGRVTWPDGRSEVFINVAGFGANAVVCRRANESSKRLGGTATFLGAILRTITDYQPSRLSWSWEGPDGAGAVEMETLGAFVANGHYCGAGLFVGRGGSMADGLFDLTILPRFSAPRAVRHLPKLYDGRFAALDGVVQARAHTVRIHTPVPIETDGEPLRDGPVVVTILPQVLQVRGGWLRPPGLAG
jgi:diacylglycerol kinase family enzyme